MDASQKGEAPARAMASIGPVVLPQVEAGSGLSYGLTGMWNWWVAMQAAASVSAVGSG